MSVILETGSVADLALELADAGIRIDDGVRPHPESVHGITATRGIPAPAAGRTSRAPPPGVSPDPDTLHGNTSAAHPIEYTTDSARTIDIGSNYRTHNFTEEATVKIDCAGSVAGLHQAIEFAGMIAY